MVQGIAAIEGKLRVAEAHSTPPAPHPESQPETASYWTETLTLAGPGDKLAAGVGEVQARQLPTAIGVRNLGTVDLVVVGAQANHKPEGIAGPGIARVAPGMFSVLYLPTKMHSFYGRPGECVEVTRYLHEVSPISVQGAKRYFPVNVGAVVSGIVYTSPWGTPVVYGGFTCRETSGIAEAVFRIRDGGPAGTIVEDISLAPQESTSDEDADTLCTSPSLYVELVSGAADLRVRVN